MLTSLKTRKSATQTSTLTRWSSLCEERLRESAEWMSAATETKWKNNENVYLYKLLNITTEVVKLLFTMKKWDLNHIVLTLDSPPTCWRMNPTCATSLTEPSAVTLWHVHSHGLAGGGAPQSHETWGLGDRAGWSRRWTGGQTTRPQLVILHLQVLHRPLYRSGTTRDLNKNWSQYYSMANFSWLEWNLLEYFNKIWMK